MDTPIGGEWTNDWRCTMTGVDYRTSEKIHTTVSEIKIFAHRHTYRRRMGKWSWYCTTTSLDNSIELRMEKIHPAVSEIFVPQSLLAPDLTCFDPMEQMGKWPWRCTTTGVDKYRVLGTEKIRPMISEICLPQSLEQPSSFPPVHLPGHPPEGVRQYPSSWKGRGVKNEGTH